MPTLSRSAALCKQDRKIEDADANLIFLISALPNLEARRQPLMTRVDDSAGGRCRRKIDILTIQSQIDAPRAARDARFSRGTLNIGVVRRVRQSKSRLL